MGVRIRVPRLVRRTWAGGLVALLVGALVVSAVAVPGYSVADLRLHDGTIFAVKQDRALLGMVNTSIKDLATATRVPDGNLDVLQEGRTIVVRSRSSNQIQSFDPATGRMGSVVSLPAAGDLALNAGKIAVISRTNGAVWFGDAAQMLARDFNKEKALLDLGENALVTVTSDGHLIGLSLTTSELVRLSGSTPVRTPVPLQLDAKVADVELSAVGDQAVVLDRTKQSIWFEGLDQAITMPMGSKAHLASPIPESPLMDGQLRALVATPRGLVGVAPKQVLSLSGPMPEGVVQRPVAVGPCAYAVVGSRLATVCADQQPTIQEIPDLPAGAEAVPRVNRNTVILNDSVTGIIWLVNDGMRKITDWERVSPADTTTKQTDPNDDPVKVDPDRTKQNRPPTAGNDDLLAREGRSTVLPVLDNDSDPDGDVLTILPPANAGEGVTLAVIRGGTGIQVTVAPGLSGSRTFTYRVSDGRGGTSAPATVRLTLESGDQKAANQPPRQFRSDPIKVAAGQQTQIRTLLDWRDPDGDDLVLQNAALAKSDDEVSFTPDGSLTFTDVNKTTGIKTVQVTVSDGSGAPVTGVVTLDVRKPQDVAPLANGDFATATTNQEIEIRPLLNDVGANLSLATVEEPTGQNASRTVDYQSRSFRFKATAPGTYYLVYKVTNGPTSSGLVRVDVSDRSGPNQPPIAARDVALLTHGGSVTIDPLLNDEDPDGDVLVIQSIKASGLSVEMRDRHLLTIKEITASSDPVTITYLVSDGYHEAVPGTIVVMASNPIGEERPVAAVDDVNVRAGDAVTVRPMTNDHSPAGLDLSLDPKLVDGPSNAWVDRDQIRFLAPAVPGLVTATYQIRDSLGRTASAQVRFNVISPDIANQPPRPLPVTGRAIAGTTVRIPIPIQNIDPNGDAVRLVGLSDGPRRGRVVSVGASWLEYEAFPEERGTDAFTYTVIDKFGARAVGEIRVGVADGAIINNDPTTVDDVVKTRPGRTAYIRPMANDYDLDGDRLSWGPDPYLTMPVPAKVVDGSAVEINVPSEKSTVFGTYLVADARGARASGNITVIADPDAPLQAPVVNDDQVEARKVFQQDSVDVPVLANDYDPDGPRSQLKLSVPSYDPQGLPMAEVIQTPDGPQLRVPIGPRLRTVRYQVTDADGLVSYGLVTIPGKDDAVPTLKDPATQLTVTAGDPLTIAVAEYVQGTRGRRVQVSSADKVIGAPGNTGSRVSYAEVSFRTEATYAGPAAITFEVVEEADTDPRQATITIPIKVLPRPVRPGEDPSGPSNQVNTPPIAPPIEIKVGAGDAPVQQNLESYVTDRQGDRFVFGHFDFPNGKPAGVNISTQGSIVTASANVDVPKGTRVVMTGRVTDLRDAWSDISVTVVVLPTTKPKTVVVDDSADAVQGRPTQVNVLANDSSALGGQLTVTQAVVELGTASNVRAEGGQVSVTPGPDFVGTMRIRYTVMDATKDPDRNVDGRLTLNVKGKPTPPGTPRQVSVGDGAFTVTWTSSLDNGLPIQKYVLTARGADEHTVSVDCPTTTCTATGLRNGVSYTATVVAVNEVGPSQPSAASAAMVPNVRPEKPNPPRVERIPGRQGGQLRITWDPPANRGTPLTDYTLLLEGGASKVIPAGQTSYDWVGLTNGRQYAFRVAATNAAGTSDSSEAGVGVPSQPPQSPTALTVQDGGKTDQGSLTGSFTATADAQNGGAPITAYHIHLSKSPTIDLEKQPDRVEQARAGRIDFAFDRLEFTTYYVLVRAVNVAGPSDPPAVSQAVQTFGAPVGTERPKATALDRKIRVTAPPAETKNKAVTEWDVTMRSNKGATVGPTRYSPTSDGGLDQTIETKKPNDATETWTVTVVPIAVDKVGPPSASDPVIPHGNPMPPQATIVSRPYSNGSYYTAHVKVDLPGEMNGNRPEDLEMFYVMPDGHKPVQPKQTITVNDISNQKGGKLRVYLKRKDTGQEVSSQELDLPPIATLTWDRQSAILTLRMVHTDQVKCWMTHNGRTVLGPNSYREDLKEELGYGYNIKMDAPPGVPSGSSIVVTCRSEASKEDFITRYPAPS